MKIVGERRRKISGHKKKKVMSPNNKLVIKPPNGKVFLVQHSDRPTNRILDHLVIIDAIIPLINFI